MDSKKTEKDEKLDEIRKEIEKWREDPNYVPILPLTLNKDIIAELTKEKDDGPTTFT